MSYETNWNGKRGIELLNDPSLNKSTAYSEAERQTLGLVGLVPDDQLYIIVTLIVLLILIHGLLTTG